MYTQQQFRFENRTSHSHGNLIPNSFIELENGTKACKGTTLFFEPYAGNEDSLVKFQGKLVFKVEGEYRLAYSNRRQKDAYRGA